MIDACIHRHKNNVLHHKNTLGTRNKELKELGSGLVNNVGTGSKVYLPRRPIRRHKLPHLIYK